MRCTPSHSIKKTCTVLAARHGTYQNMSLSFREHTSACHGTSAKSQVSTCRGATANTRAHHGTSRNTPVHGTKHLLTHQSVLVNEQLRTHEHITGHQGTHQYILWNFCQHTSPYLSRNNCEHTSTSQDIKEHTSTWHGISANTWAENQRFTNRRTRITNHHQHMHWHAPHTGKIVLSIELCFIPLTRP